MTKAGNELEVVAASISPENLALFQQAAGALDLKVVGFEVLCEDLLQPLSSSCGGITKVDAEPSLQLYAAPDGEAAADLAALFLRRLLRQHPIAYLKAYLKNHCCPLQTLLPLFICFGIAPWLGKLPQKFLGSAEGILCTEICAMQKFIARRSQKPI